MDYQEKLYYQNIDSEIEKLKNCANTFGYKVYTNSMRQHQLSVFIDLDKYFITAVLAEQQKIYGVERA